MKRLLLRTLAAIGVAACAYAIVLWATGGNIEYSFIAMIVAIPVFLIVQRLLGGTG
jgi:hypothetical protein